MSHYQDEVDDLLMALADRDAEIRALQDEMQALMGQWLFAETHSLTICDMTWIERNKITVLDTPDGKWELSRDGKRLCVADTIKQAVSVVRAFELDA